MRRRSIAWGWTYALLTLVLLFLAAAACGGTLEVGIEREPMTEAAPTTAVAALLAENARLSTEVAARLTPTSAEVAASASATPPPPLDVVGAPAASPTDAPTVTPILASATSAYADPKLGFTFDYPARWYVNDAGSVISLTSYDTSAAPGAGGVPVGEAKIDIAFSEPGRNQGLEAMAAEARVQANAAGGGVLWEQRWELTEGVPAVRLQITGLFGQVAALYTVIGGRSIRVIGYGDLSRFDEIARTLRPAR